MTENEWYWDLARKRAVRAADRGPGDQTLGPYASRGEAENWHAKLDERNEQWEEADDEWEHPEADGD